MAKVFDSSAVLAALLGEAGEEIRPELPEGIISAVNAAETITVLVRKGMPLEDATTVLRKTLLTVRDYTVESAIATASLLSPQARGRGLPLGERACMATGLLLELPVITAERSWAGLDLPGGLQIEVIP